MTAQCKISYNKTRVEGGGGWILPNPLQGEKTVTGPQDEVTSGGLWSGVKPGSAHFHICGLGSLWFINLENYIAVDISSFNSRVPKNWDNTGEMAFLQ